jgi:hypothetical protein
MHILLTQKCFGTYVKQVRQDRVRLILSHALDPASETLVDEDALPSGHSCSWSVFCPNGYEKYHLTVCSDHRVDCLKRGALVQRRSAWDRSQWLSQPGCLFVEELCIMDSGQSLQECGHRW